MNDESSEGNESIPATQAGRLSCDESVHGHLAEKFVEVVVRTNPEPLDDITLAIADCANV